MNDAAGKVVLITGATDGLGRALAVALARRGAIVLLHGRSAERLAATEQVLRREARQEPGGAYVADLASLGTVRDFALEVARDHRRIDILINNAGIGPGAPGSPRQTSVDGYELRFAVNYLAPFLLTNQLLATLRCSAPARILNIASSAQAAIDFGNIMLTGSYDGLRAYRQSKLALIAFTFELARRLAQENEHGLTINALHPASLMSTKLVFEAFGRAETTVAHGLEATLWLALAPELSGVSGRYFREFREARAHRQASDAGERIRLWQLSMQLVAAHADRLSAAAGAS